MPKMTTKYSGALAKLRYHNGNLALPADQRIIVDWMDDQEALYVALNEAGYFWDSAAKLAGLAEIPAYSAAHPFP